MLKLPRNRDVEIELGTGELEIVPSPGRYTSADRASLGRPRTRAGQSSAPPPAFRSAPPAAFHGQQAHQAQAQLHQAQLHQAQQFRPHTHQAPSHYAPQAHLAHPVYAPPVPWTPAYASAQNSGSFPATAGSIAAVTDPTSRHFAIVSTSASRKDGPSGLVWAATLIVMGAFLGAMYGVYMRNPATTASAGSVAASPIQGAPLQPVAVPVPAQPAVTPTVALLSPAPHPAGSLVGVVGPASPVVIPGKPVEEPVASNGKGHGKHGAPPKHDVASAPQPSGTKKGAGSGSVAAALPVGKPKPTPPAAPVTKASGKTADEIAAQKMIDDLKAQRTL